ncbi:CGH_1_HP_G0128800.mRNA.1.CDS.1 [Saccharomyces cerevisiae]|nr:CGH_1_HP_G0002760.mRNA.1.CDS.1 [Saccharomyces cerevisiae]CAI5103776.1 CGH_1_HP_G0128800.mRNA.1.CDS.1 [Saccharomyces cerevisiae]CAI6931855.1 CGH_1_HP_G0002760.mRNA.1.CDS.1 [Saccharomyces cerevisiae]CAI6976867.1 CGH_1_HP_G0128800.mRNA.1.CDS.1 [Saccharomyces cerevisiae]
MGNITLMIKATPLTAQKSGYFTFISDSVPAPPLAPGYSSMLVYKSDSSIGTGDFINVSWTSYSEFSQYTSLLVTGMQGDGVSSFPSGGSSSKMAPKKKKVAYIVLLFPIHCCASHLIFFHK